MARPSFTPTPEQRRRVLIAAGAGVTHRKIALALGIHRNTLAKHFFCELQQAAAKAQLDVACGLMRAALAGNVCAAREYLRRSPERFSDGSGQGE